MTTNKAILWSLGALMAGVGLAPASAGVRHCATEECACEEALSQNTIEALEAFLRQYPQSTSGAGHANACAALGVPLPEKGTIERNDGKSIEPPDEDDTAGG